LRGFLVDVELLEGRVDVLFERIGD